MGIPVNSGFEKRSVRYAAIASQNIKISDPFALAASKHHSERANGLQIKIYWSNACSNSVYLPVNRFVNKA